MKKRKLKKYMLYDDSFTGEYLDSKFTGLPFNFCTSGRHGKDDLIPRVHIIPYNDEYPCKMEGAISYQVLKNGKLKRLTIFNNNYNKEYEEILQRIMYKYYKNLYSYFFLGDLYLGTEEFNQKAKELI